MKYIKTESKIVAPGEKVLINNQCKSPVEIAAGVVFQEDGDYIVSVHEGKITVSECGKAFKKPDETPPQIIKAACCAEEKLKAKADELYEEFVAQKRFQIEQLKAEIEELKSKRKPLDYKAFFENPPIYPAYTGFNKCGETNKEKK